MKVKRLAHCLLATNEYKATESVTSQSFDYLVYRMANMMGKEYTFSENHTFVTEAGDRHPEDLTTTTEPAILNGDVIVAPDSEGNYAVLIGNTYYQIVDITVLVDQEPK